MKNNSKECVNPVKLHGALAQRFEDNTENTKTKKLQKKTCEENGVRERERERKRNNNTITTQSKQNTW